MGYTQNYAREVDSGSWQTRYGLTAAQAEVFSLVHELTSRQPDGSDKNIVHAIYEGSGAITLSNYNSFPVGSTITATGIGTKTLYLKVAATTWVKNEFASI